MLEFLVLSVNLCVVALYVLLVVLTFRKMKNTKIEETDSDEYFAEDSVETETNTTLKV